MKGTQRHDVNGIASADLGSPLLKAVGTDTTRYRVDKASDALPNDLTSKINR
jgi:hypothetical protein